MTSTPQSGQGFFRKKSTRIILLVLAVALAAFWFTRPAATPPRTSGEKMRAVVYHEYGSADVLRLEEVDQLLPEDHQVLVRVRAAAANPLDWHYMRGTPYVMRVLGAGFLEPSSTRLGADMAGEVVAVGRNVTKFKPGDEVFGTGGGAFAEYVRASAGKIVLKPAELSFEQAAAVPVAALTALQGLRDKGRIRAGQKVLINGASGGVGTFAVQIAKSYGAEVTGVCSTRNVDLVRSLGADHVVDYTREDVTRGEQRYDLILDNVGTRPLSDFRRVMSPQGVYVLIGGGGPDDGRWVGPLVGPVKALLYSPFVSQDFVSLMAEINAADLEAMLRLVSSGKVTPVIDRTYPLQEVPAAIRYLEQGRARGKVIITVAGPTS